MKLTKTLKVLALPLALLGGFNALAAGGTNAVAPVTARDFYNAGTALLAAGKYDAAEGLLHSALSAQDSRVQPRALYNIGEARFAEGVEILKKGPGAGPALARGRNAYQLGEQVVREGNAALADNDLGRMINAYIAGHGARKQVREVEKALNQAMEKYGDTLRKWQRAADDFQGAAELNPADTNAVNNAALVQQYIARLVDSLRQMRQMAAMLGDAHQQLNELLSKLKGKVPAMQGAPGAGDGDEDEDKGMKPDALAGQKENPTRAGDQMQIPLSPDLAGHLLDGLSLNGGRRLSMVDTNTSQPHGDKGLTW
jgi:tetratricopeptide (TPR) repeat protein